MMNRGILIFAHSSPDIDYGVLSIIAGGLAKKNLNLPVSIVTDTFTIDSLKKQEKYDLLIDIFDKIILVDSPVNNNYRNLHNGTKVEKVPFINSNRFSAYDLTPYEHTLLIDSDFLIFSDRLNNYWDLDTSLMLSHSLNDYVGNRVGILDRYVSDTSIHLYWATAVMFKKDNHSQKFFNLVEFVKDNYRYFSDLFKFDSRQYRNDISFSIAKHILDGFYHDFVFSLPPVLTVQDKDLIEKIDPEGRITFLLDQGTLPNSHCLGSIKDVDIHIMNKKNILENSQTLLGLL